jgi:hypothetical protein
MTIRTTFFGTLTGNAVKSARVSNDSKILHERGGVSDYGQFNTQIWTTNCLNHLIYWDVVKQEGVYFSAKQLKLH